MRSLIPALLCSLCSITATTAFMQPSLRTSLLLRNAAPMMCAKSTPSAEVASVPFTQEMRQKAMSLHTFSQAPREGKQKDASANTVVDQWETTKEDYLQFLVDSKVVYEAFEKEVQRSGLEKFRNTGLERVRGLEKDIEWIEKSFNIKPLKATDQSKEYAQYLSTLSIPVFLTHFYNYYFAHTAGGRMIGKQVMDSVFDGHLFEFYKWDGDVKEILTKVKGFIDETAEGWTREMKDEALDSTPETFKWSGALLRVLVGKARDRAVRTMNKVQVKGGKLIAVSPSPYSTRKAAWDV